jgi:hypothetical protein
LTGSEEIQRNPKTPVGQSICALESSGQIR